MQSSFRGEELCGESHQAGDETVVSCRMGCRTVTRTCQFLLLHPWRKYTAPLPFFAAKVQTVKVALVVKKNVNGLSNTQCYIESLTSEEGD